MIKLTQFVQQFHVARIFLEQRLQREHANLRPAGRDRRFFQRQVRLSIVRFPFQNLFDHFHRVLRCFFDLALCVHDGDWGDRNVKETFLARFLFRDFSPAQ